MSSAAPRPGKEARALPHSGKLHGTWLVLIMASIGMTVIAYNTTAVTVMPNLQAEFDLRSTTLQWVMTIYTVSAAALVPAMGRLGDRVGKMRSTCSASPRLRSARSQ